MYNELVQRLREHNGWALNETLDQAADAIENTSKAYEMMAEAYEAEVTKYRWIPVTERLPEIGKKVLVFSYGNATFTARMQEQTENGYPVFECNGTFLEMAKLGRITHWMPLPEPPKEETDG